MEYLKTLDENRKEWVKYLHKMGALPSDVEDIIQDAYLRIVAGNYGKKVIKKNGKINKTYFWRVLHTVFIYHVKAKNKKNEVSIDVSSETFVNYNNPLVISLRDSLKSEAFDEAKEKATEIFISKLHDEVNKLDKGGKYPYNKEMFTLYVDTKLSMRGIRDEVGISLTSVFNTIKNCKAQLSEELLEDFEDLLSEDYELIKK